MRSKIFLPLFVALFSISMTAYSQTAVNDHAAVTGKADFQTIKIKVAGINCSADCKDIESAVKEIKGVTACKMKGKPGATTAFEVSFDPALVSETDIRKAVESTPGCSDPDSRPYKMKG